MEILFSRFQSVTLDHIQSVSFSSFNAESFNNKDLFSGYCFSLNRRKWRNPNPFSQISCFSMEQRIHPRRMQKPSKIGFEGRRQVLDNAQIQKPSAALCSQIEKLVLCNRYREALELFEIFEPRSGCDVGSSTYDALVSACIGLKSIRGVKRVFSYMINDGFEPGMYMRNRVLLMHVKCGLMYDARKLFDEMLERDLVSWNTMITGLVDSGNYFEAFRLFLIMWEEFSDRSSHTFALMVRASAGLGLICVGTQIHSCALKLGVADVIFVSCALIDMYSKCGSIEDAQFVFEQMPEKTTVGWNSIIAGYALHGYSEEALSIYYEMQECGVKMDHFTFSIVVRICTRLSSFEHAKQAHAALVRHGFGSDIVANTALVDFYCKWGRMEDAMNVFERMPCKNLETWNAMIGGYGNHGQGDKAVEMFEQMLREKMIPNHVTFLAVLSACSYSGLSEQGWKIFQSMSRDHKIKPRAMHYACMIELLGRDGLLDEGFALIRGAPFKPTANMWAALLTACRMNENLELGRFAAEKLYEMEPEKLSNYVVLFNIYNGAGKLKEAAGVVQTLKRKGLRILPSCSWIDVKKQPHAFLSGDKSHVQTKEIYQTVDKLMLEIAKHGYVVEKKTLLPDVDEEAQHLLSCHSEKLTIAFGLINSPGWIPLLITQSHRMCGDCHNAVKYIAMVTGREIVVRDASRFHHFRNGTCSCGDYW